LLIAFRMSIQILIADDHEVVRSGLRSLVADTEIQVVAEATTGNDALKLALKHKPDVVILDIRMPDGDGLSTLEAVKQKLPKTPVLMLSTYDSPTYAARAHALGASGYLRKGDTRENLLAAIRTAATGASAWDAADLRRVSGGATDTTVEQSDLEVPLTPRELQVLRQLSLGLSNKEIALALHISVETVKEHVQHIFKKLGASDRTQVAVWAVRRGLA
jgi:DNA-binding NarL/FixJ family response regulator